MRSPALLRTLLAFVFPDACVSCGEPLDASSRNLCPRCAARVVLKPGSVGIPVPPDVQASATSAGVRTAAEARTGPLRAHYAIEFEGPARALVHALKYEGRTSLARCLARLAAPVAASLLPASDSLRGAAVAVSHVPLAPVKRRERGFDQCELLAAELARMLGVPHVRLLVRVRNGVVQAESGRAERLAMRSDTFAPAEGADPGPGRLLLIDDVVTTGATMAAAAHAIMRTGLWRTECLAVAGTPPNERHTGAESG